MIQTIYGSVLYPETGLKLQLKKLLAKLFGITLYWVFDPIEEHRAKAYDEKAAAYAEAQRLVNSYGLKVTVVEQFYY